MMNSYRFAAACLVLGTAVAGGLATRPAAAQVLLDRGESIDLAPQRQPWALTIGALGGLAPDYEGSDNYDFFAAPTFDLRYRDLAFLSTRDGLGVAVLRIGGFRAGPMVRVRQGRDADNNDALKGLGDVGATVEGGVFASYTMGSIKFGLDAVQGLNGEGHRGATVHVNAGYSGRLAERWLFSAGPSITWASDNYTRAFFGIDQGQSARSGYAVYSPNAGFKDIAFGGTVTWRFADAAAVTAIAEVKQLLNDAADSPIVDSKGSATQGFLGLAVTYRFGW